VSRVGESKGYNPLADPLPCLYLLLVDEPTSGLDGQTAYNVVRFLKKLSNAGQAILCSELKEKESMIFTKLLLLIRSPFLVCTLSHPPTFVSTLRTIRQTSLT